ncbi:MAG TPA: NADH:flavin oxidoreductase [Smithellaceae bacterium]|nr:NADH:flavin oxidoreductase [Smithellaceae bacterium]HRS83732.1 NADH:flavin oxidoreductase [Smithellaceae bacterium]HRV45219.1 NADH:flavin oxidoreductase [Smithellaceae bacterium]
MSILFESARLKNMTLRNRFVRSATYDGMSDPTGQVTDRQISWMDDLAAGGVGLIVTAIMYVHPSGQVSSFMNSIAEDACIPGLQKLARTAHQRGAKIAVQLYHGGREARFVKTRGRLPAGPSVIADDPFYRWNYREMTEEEIRVVVHAFGEAARRAREAGFDAVQIHGAHGYLFSQFLSPFTNRREDSWGGSLENRLRLHKEVYASVRREAGADYPVMIKLGVQDGFPGGLTIDEGVRAARMLADAGYDALEISSGVRGEKYEGTEYRTRIHQSSREGYFRKWARDIKKRIGVPVIAVGGLKSVAMMEEMIRRGEADFISLCRPLISEPDLIRSWEADPAKKPRCVYCNQCLEAVHRGIPLCCVAFSKGEPKTSKSSAAIRRSKSGGDS